MTSGDIEGEASSGGTTPADPPGPGPASAQAAAPHSSAGSASARKRWLGVEEIAFIALLALAIGGMAVADFSARSGLSYWLVVIPLFGAVSVSRAGGAPARTPGTPAPSCAPSSCTGALWSSPCTSSTCSNAPDA